MVQSSVIRSSDLDIGWILAPERYDPRRIQPPTDGTPISDFASLIREAIVPGTADGRAYLVLDTSDAAEGFIRQVRSGGTKEQLGSQKKVTRPGDVIVSRLRPYLRQVGYVDAGLTDVDGQDCVLAVSTEFIVLRSRDSQSIAFLVPYLLGDFAQSILAASQEGGHHPRVDASSIAQLRVAQEILNSRQEISAQVESAVGMARVAEQMIRRLSGRRLSTPGLIGGMQGTDRGAEAKLRLGL